MRRMVTGIGTLAAVALLEALPAYGNAYKILCVKSAKATAMGEAFVVQADDPSAIAFNPAGLAQVSGTRISVQGTWCNAYTEHESPAGVKTDMEDRWQFVPSLFLTSDMGTDGLTVGLGLSLPNGLSSEWAEDSFARYVATFSDLVVADISPALGLRVSDRVMVGVGLNLMYSEAELKRMIDGGAAAGLPGAMDVESRLSGDGTGWTANGGVIVALNSRHSVAATYRPGFTIDYDGDVVTGGARIPAEASIDFPAVAVVGYAYRPTARLKLEFNADWTEWNAVDDITVSLGAPGFADTVQAQDLHNTVAYKVGAEYRWSDGLTLRGGYIYNENATGEATWRPSLPDTDVHFFTAGVGYSLERVTLDAAVQLVFYETRSIDNNVDGNETFSASSIDGTYRTFAPCGSLALNYRF